MSLPKAVQAAAERQWSIIPVRADKRPAIPSWKGFQTERPSLQQLQAWADRPGVTGWAVITGKVSNLVILDFDGDDGRKLLKELKLRAHVTTGSGGAHVYLQHPGWAVPTLNSKSSGEMKKRWPGLDIRADGGYAVFWGKNKSGQYRWLRKAELEPLGAIPADLRHFLHLMHPPEARTNGAGPSAAAGEVDYAGRLLDRAIASARVNGRNNAGFWYACQLRDNRVPEQLARGLMERFAASVGELNQKGEREAYTAAEAHASLRKAYEAAPREPLKAKREQPPAKKTAPPPVLSEEDRQTPKYQGQEYVSSKHGLFYFRRDRDGFPVAHKLTNFPAEIVADVVKDDGETTSRAVKIRATLRNQVRDVVISAGKFGIMDWPIEELGTAAIVYPNYRDRVRAAIQTLSKSVAEQYVYQHTGWTKIDGRHVYLHAGGGIGERGPVGGLEVELDRELRRFELPAPPSGKVLRQAIQCSLDMLEVAPDRVTFPIYCAIWRAVLGIVDVSIHLAGQTGSGKSQIAALAQQHFGLGLDAKHLPATWDSTANALQAIAFFTKNALLVVDDFVPKGASSDVARLHREADRLLRAQGNHAGRQRMTADAKIRPPRTPRGLILSTGEDVPKGNSLRARLVVVEMDPQDMNWDWLTECQRQANAGTYAAAMAGFLQWVAPQMAEMPARIMQQLSLFREQWGESGQHKRTPDNLANLSCGLEVFLDFARAHGAVTPTTASQIWQRALDAFKQAAEAQEKAQSHAEPTQQFLELIMATFTAGQAHIATRDGKEPRDAAAWGWIHNGMDWKPQGMKIGWIDGDTLLLDPKPAFAAAQRMGRDISDPIPVSLPTLSRRLKQRGILAESDPGRETTTVRRFCEGRRVNVFSIPLGVLYRREKPDQPDPCLKWVGKNPTHEEKPDPCEAQNGY